MSFLPASLESLLGDAGTPVCYPTLKKTLQGEGRELKAFSIIQQSELPAAPVGARGRPARAPGLGLAGLGEGWLLEGQPSRSHSAPALLQCHLQGGAERAAAPGRQAWSCLCPADSDCAVEWRQRVGEVPRARVGCLRGSQGGRACPLSAGEGQAAQLAPASWATC